MTAEERLALIASLTDDERRNLLAYIAGYRATAFDAAVKAWQEDRK
jgi:hypothetical protein